jgi:hypothetical protein
VLDDEITADDQKKLEDALLKSIETSEGFNT